MSKNVLTAPELVSLLIDHQDVIRSYIISQIPGSPDVRDVLQKVNDPSSRERTGLSADTFHSTVAGEVARSILVYSPLRTLPDAPDEYDRKTDLFEALVSAPTVWDDTVFLGAEFGSHISVARRTGSQWFIAAATDEHARTIDLDLDFLDPATNYLATFYRDTVASDGWTHPEAYEVTQQTVTRDDVISAYLAPGGGQVIRFELVP